MEGHSGAKEKIYCECCVLCLDLGSGVGRL